jgi:hypothetical protein
MGFDDVLVRTIFNQVVHPKIVSILLDKTEVRVIVTSRGLKFFERL